MSKTDDLGGITKICNGVPSYRVGEESRANPKGLTLLPNIYTSERYQLSLEFTFIIIEEFAGGEMTRQSQRGLGLPFTHKIKLDSKIQAVYTLRHEPTKPNQTDPDEECKHKIRLQFA